jgi:hypothetical protein
MRDIKKGKWMSTWSHVFNQKAEIVIRKVDAMSFSWPAGFGIGACVTVGCRLPLC